MPYPYTIDPLTVPNGSVTAPDRMRMSLYTFKGYVSGGGGEEGEMKLTPGVQGGALNPVAITPSSPARFIADLTAHLGGAISVTIAANASVVAGTPVKVVLSEALAAGPASGDFAPIWSKVVALMPNQAVCVQALSNDGDNRLPSGYYAVDVTTQAFPGMAGTITVYGTLATGD